MFSITTRSFFRAFAFLLILVSAVFPLAAQQPEKNPDEKKEEKPDKKKDEKMPDVVVTTTRLSDTEGIEKDRVPANIAVLEGEAIRRTEAKTLPDYLIRELGIHTLDNAGDGRNQGLGLRGFGSGDVTVMVDGVIVNRPDNNSVDWAAIPLENIDRVEILRGSASAIAGRGASGGVINILTKDRIKNSFIKAKAEAGSNSFIKGTLSQGWLCKDLSYYGYESRELGDGFRDNMEFRRTSSFHKFNLPVDKFDFTLSYLLEDSLFQQPSSLFENQLHADRTQSRKIRNDSIAYDLNQFTANVAHRFSDTLDFHLNLAHRDNESTQVILFGFGGNEVVNEENTWSTALQGRWHQQGDWFDHVLSFGAELRDMGYDTDSFSTDIGGHRLVTGFNPDPSSDLQDSRALEQAIYGFWLNSNFEIQERFTLSGGLRADQTDYDFKNKLTFLDDDQKFYRTSWSAGATFDVNDDLNLYTSYSNGFRLPTLPDMYGFSNFGGANNPNLKPELSKTFEFGARYDFQHWLHAEADYFISEKEDEIQTVTLFPGTPENFFFDAIFQNQNIGNVDRKGIEISLSADLLQDKAHIWAKGTFMDAEFGDGVFPKGNDLPMVPKRHCSLGASYDFLDYFSFSMDGLFIDDRIRDDDQQHTLEALDSYWVWNARLSFQYQNFKAWAGVTNAFDRKFETWASLFGPAFMPGPEREFWFGLEYGMDF